MTEKTLNEPKRSLFQLHPWRLDIILLILLSMGMIYLGLNMPVITMKTMVFWTDTFSVLSGIAQLKAEGYEGLALIVFVFSVVFPFTKLSSLLIIWFTRMTDKRREYMLHWLGLLGKWSMLDVFVLAITIVLAKAGKLIDARPRIGLYVFGAAVLLSMVVTFLFDRIAMKHKKR